MSDLLYQWPARARFDRRIPKEKFYAHGTVSTAIREEFVSKVQRITWAYKLAEATINLPGNAEVPEVQVFQILAKEDDVSEQVLIAIDKAIPYPIIFEITSDTVNEQQVRMIASYKQLGSGAPKLSDYYSTGWQAANGERQPLPTAINLPALYTALLEQLTPVAVRPGEELVEVTARLATVRKLEREIVALERKLRGEPQLNLKIELRRTLKTKRQLLEQQR
jgi:hypothetical protein